MTKYSDSFALLIIKNVRKECFVNNVSIPSDHLILSLLKLFILNPDIPDDYSDAGKAANELIQMIMIFLKTSNSPSIITLKMQLFFRQNQLEKTILLHSRQEQINQNIRPLQCLIFQKTVKSREDYDQLYHHICCIVVLMNGIGDPSDNETLKETIAALKSILTSKDLARLSSKPRSLKEKQLHDIIRIVTGILVYNKNQDKKEDVAGDLTTVLETTLQKFYNFLENKLLELEGRISSLIHLFLKFYSDEETENLFSENLDHTNNEQSRNESAETGKYIKSYIICMQQYKLYFRILIQIISSLREEFKLCLDQLQKRILRIRKTVKFRNAIPPQFKDVSLSWGKMQEISTLLNNVVDIISYLRNAFEKTARPQFDLIRGIEKSNLNLELNAKICQDVISNLDSQCCEYILLDDPNIYSFNVEFAEFCIVMFVETQGILTQGIREYGLIKYQNAYFSFSSLSAMTKFFLSPNSYIETLLKLAFVWPETINLLGLQEWFKKKDAKMKIKHEVEKRCVKETGIQTDVHPVPTSRDYKHDSNFWYLKKRVAQIEKNFRTHSVQTDISNFRKNMITQTTITIKPNL